MATPAEVVQAAIDMLNDAADAAKGDGASRLPFPLAPDV